MNPRSSPAPPEPRRGAGDAEPLVDAIGDYMARRQSEQLGLPYPELEAERADRRARRRARRATRIAGAAAVVVFAVLIVLLVL